MAAEWLQNPFGEWFLADGDNMLKRPQPYPDNDGLPRRYAGGLYQDPANPPGLDRALALLAEINGDPNRRGNGGPGLVGLGLGPNNLFGNFSLDPCMWLEWLRDQGNMPGWLDCKTFKWLLLFIIAAILLGGYGASKTVIELRR